MTHHPPIFLLLTALLLSGCYNPSIPQKDGPPKYTQNIAHIKNPTPRYLPKSRYGNPPSYTVNGERYHVLPTAIGYHERGIASWYGSKFTGKFTSTRERYDPYKMTAASPVLPIPCYARVTNLENGRYIIVKVNDRGPFAPNRIIDLSYAAAIKLGYERKGTALVDVQAIDARNPLTPSTRLPKHPRLYVQLGAFRHYKNAFRLQSEISDLLHKTLTIRTSKQDQNTLYHVELGPLRGVGQSDRIQARLRQYGYRKAIVSIR